MARMVNPIILVFEDQDSTLTPFLAVIPRNFAIT